MLGLNASAFATGCTTPATVPASSGAQGGIHVLDAFIPGLLFGGAVYLMATDQPQACDSAPDHLVSWKGQPGYRFVSGGCDFVAKQAQFDVID